MYIYRSIYTTLKFLALQGAPYIYDISRLRVKQPAYVDNDGGGDDNNNNNNNTFLLINVAIPLDRVAIHKKT
jgi:hypothetical protein